MHRPRRAACASVRRHAVPPSQMLGHWDANYGHDGAADASAVSTWADRSGSRTLTQGTGANQPTFRRQGLYGQRSIRGDGTNDKLANTSGAPFAGRATASYLLVLSSGTSQTNKYVVGQAESTAGSNGVDVRFSGASALRIFAKTDTTSTEIVVGTLYSTAARPVAAEFAIDLTKPSREIAGTGSSDGFGSNDLGGSTLDASGGEFVLFDFSTVTSIAASVDFHEVALLTRPMCAGERRRWYRYALRRWQVLRPTGPWSDASITL